MRVKKNHVWVVAVHAAKVNVTVVAQAKVIVIILVNLLQYAMWLMEIPSAFFLENLNETT